MLVHRQRMGFWEEGSLEQQGGLGCEQSMDFEMYNKYLRYWGSLEAASDMLTDATGTHIALLPEVREMSLFGRWEMVLQVPEDFWLLSNHQKSSCSPG